MRLEARMKAKIIVDLRQEGLRMSQTRGWNPWSNQYSSHLEHFVGAIEPYVSLTTKTFDPATVTDKMMNIMRTQIKQSNHQKMIGNSTKITSGVKNTTMNKMTILKNTLMNKKTIIFPYNSYLN